MFGKKKPKKDMDMLNGSLWKNILLFAIPLAVTSIMQQAFHSIDMAVVGRFCGPTELAAVGSNGAIINLLVNMFLGLSTGSNVIIARFIGAGEMGRARKSIGTSLAIAVASGVFVMILGICLSPTLLKLISSPPDVIGLATIYLRIYFMGIPFSMVYNFSAAILRSRGETTKPFYCLATGGVANIILNLVMVVGFHMGVSGVAIATAVSNAISCTLILLIILKEQNEFKISLKDIKFDKSIFLKILKIGLPMSVQSCLFPLSNMILQSAINSLGTTVVAGSTASATLENFNYAIEGGFTNATVSFVSQNYGAKNLKRCRKVLRVSIAMDVAIISSFCFIMYLFMSNVVGIFTTDPQVAAIAAQKLTVMYLFFPCWILVNQFTAALRGLGYSIVPTIVSVAGICGFRIFWIYTVFAKIGSFISLLLVYPTSWILVFVVLIICYIVIIKKEVKKLEV